MSKKGQKIFGECRNGTGWAVIGGAANFLARCRLRAAPIMNDSIKRSVLRWIHMVFGIPIVGDIYSPFPELPNYAPTVRYVAVPVILTSGICLWKGRFRRQSISPSKPI